MLFLILPALASPFCVRASQPVGFKPALDLALTGAGAGTFLVGRLIPQHEASPWVPPLDRDVPTHPDENAARASDDLLIGLSAAAVVNGGLIGGICWGNQRSLASLYPILEVVEMEALANGPNQLLKRAVGRPRPYTQGDGFTGKDDDFQSFYSGHTTNSAATTSLMAGMWARSLTDRRWVWASAQILAGTAGGLGVGSLRVMAARHYWSDVMVGTGAGVLAGFLPFLPDYLNRNGLELTILPMPDGWMLSGRF